MTDTQARMDQAFALVAAAVDVLLARTQGMDGLDENLQLSRVLDDLQVAGADPASPEVLDDDALAGESVVSLLGGDIDEEVDNPLPVHLGLAEFDPLIIFPLGGNDLADQSAMHLVLVCSNLFGDDVADQIPPRQHVRIGPFGLGRGVVDPRIQRFAPEAGHLLVPELLRIAAKLLIQLVEGAGLILGRARHVRDERVVPNTLLREPSQIVSLLLDNLLQPADRILLTPVDRPLDLVDHHLRGIDRAQTVSATVRLA
ncbi:hypothetical protein [Arsenicicoccus sp. UBA7492]|uniref:hypothetical protein n=1 Tax=Arsenicicoccus sp. UBA7492 TaxID=1946057 RepID=UPI00257E1BCC|nr:hypothetical protein [Arsenicicoccus sp. UBA7492]